MTPSDLHGYFARIGYTGPPTPTLATLNALTRAHVESIPFENLDVLLGRPISVELAAIENKLVGQQRGGYCFEHNTLLLHVLQALGFSVTMLGARARYLRPVRYSVPQTHAFLRVDFDGEPYLVDVGFGGLSPTAALRLALDVTQETPHEPRRIVSEGAWSGLALRAPDAVLLHQAHLANRWHDLYEFTLDAMPPVDREMANWYTRAHPRSHFRDHLMVARATEDGRVTLQDRELTLRRGDGDVRRHVLTSQSELRGVLAERFGLLFSHETRFECSSLCDLP